MRLWLDETRIERGLDNIIDTLFREKRIGGKVIFQAFHEEEINPLATPFWEVRNHYVI